MEHDTKCGGVIEAFVGQNASSTAAAELSALESEGDQ